METFQAYYYRCVAVKKSIADAAMYYGFTDQPHLSRIFKRMFGILAKLLLKNSRFIQFISLVVYVVLVS